MKIERMQANASDVPRRPVRKIKAESMKTLSDDAVSFDADRRKQGEESPLQQDSDEAPEENAAVIADTQLKTTASIDIVV
jgi:hypothetical protein